MSGSSLKLAPMLFSGTTMIAWLAGPWLAELVERDEHERAAFAGGGRGFDEEVLLAALLVGEFLHGAHAEGVGFGRAA